MRAWWRLLCLLLLALPLASCQDGPAGSGQNGPLEGYWKVWHSEGTVEVGPEHMTIHQSGNHATMTVSCNSGSTPMSGEVRGAQVTFTSTENGVTTTAQGTISEGHMAGTWVNTSGGSGTWRADRTDEKPDYSCVRSGVSVFCVRFSNDQYWVEGVIQDPAAVVGQATLTGSHISAETPFTYGLYANRPGQWWTNPNVFISQGAEPVFPLEYVVHVRFKNGTSEDFTRSVTSWEWAVSGEDPPQGSRYGSMPSGASFDFSTGTVDPSGTSGDFRYSSSDMIGLAAPSGVSWWTGEGVASFQNWISHPDYLPPPEAYTPASGTAGSPGRYTRWLKTAEGRYAMLFSLRETSSSFEFYYVEPYGSFAWSDHEAPQRPVVTQAVPGNGTGELVVRWSRSPSSDVAGYWVFYGATLGSRTGKLAGDATEYTLTGLPSGSPQYVSVLAYDHEGNQSDFSDSVLGTPR